MIKTVLVGFGFSANTFHLPFLKAIDSFEVSGVVSTRPTEVHSELPDVSVYATLDEALQSDATLFVITTPTHLHKEMIVDCLKAGKDVLVEKPAFLTTAEGYELMELESQSRGLVNVYQNRRYDGDFLTIKSLLDSNQLGEWKVIESRFDRFRPNVRDRWRENAGPGAGILFDLGSHLIDQTLALLGKPDKIQADVMIQREDGQSDDGFYVTLYYGEKRVYLRSNPFIAGETPRFEVHGTKGSFVKFGLDPQEEALKQGKLSSDVLETGILSTDESETIQVEKGDYLMYYQQLAESYVTRQPVVSLKDATLTTQMIELARQSSESGEMITLN
ncbi:Gfo/Idh/MocA family oxidoreductase [Exiguobacterium qingdaonense]|uniref:Gfo/Idh/MocA family oxidoreductase n=1 Tax=Exiguobacterium qingdaonense TaxID=2751251 RepID=UPI001BE9497C|nr:Gfo/Idh/MocA family oxidoreductase [Exiguobacterium qingdaonense]